MDNKSGVTYSSYLTLLLLDIGYRYRYIMTMDSYCLEKVKLKVIWCFMVTSYSWNQYYS